MMRLGWRRVRASEIRRPGRVPRRPAPLAARRRRRTRRGTSNSDSELLIVYNIYIYKDTSDSDVWPQPRICGRSAATLPSERIGAGLASESASEPMPCHCPPPVFGAARHRIWGRCRTLRLALAGSEATMPSHPSPPARRTASPPRIVRQPESHSLVVTSAATRMAAAG